MARFKKGIRLGCSGFIFLIVYCIIIANLEKPMPFLIISILFIFLIFVAYQKRTDDGASGAEITVIENPTEVISTPEDTNQPTNSANTIYTDSMLDDLFDSYTPDDKVVELDDQWWHLRQIAFDAFNRHNLELAVEWQEKACQVAHELKKHCSKTPQGRKYFREMYEECHSADDPCFSLLTREEDCLQDWKNNADKIKEKWAKEERIKEVKETLREDLLYRILTDPGVRQATLVNEYEPYLAYTVRKGIDDLVAANKIVKTKAGNSYALTVATPKENNMRAE